MTLGLGLVESIYAILLGLVMATLAQSAKAGMLDITFFSSPLFLRIALPLLGLTFLALAFTPLARLTDRYVIALNSFSIPRKFRWEEINRAKLISVLGLHNLLLYKENGKAALWVPMPTLSRKRIRAFMEENVDTEVVKTAVKSL